MPATEWVNGGGSAVGVFPSTVTFSDGKTQCLLQNASPPGPINAPSALAATYKTQYYLTAASSYGNPTGQGWYDAGSTATFAVTSPASGGAGTQYTFTGWASSDTGGYTGADASHSSTVNSPITETASWKTQWQVTFAVNPSPGGTVTVNGQPSATAWYDDGAVINVQASDNTGYAFSSWSGDVASITLANSSSSSTTVTIHGTGTITANLLHDTTPPVITSTVTPSANGNGWNNGPVTVTWLVSDPESGIASSDGCTTTTLNNETPLEGTALTCTVTNGAGLSNSASVAVKIDLTAPILTLQSLTVEATGSSGAPVSYTASASDSLSGVDTFSCTPASGSIFPLGNSNASCSAKDKAGNTATGTFAVTVQDKTVPVVTVPADITVDDTDPSGAVVTFSASASDLVDGSVPVTCSPASGSTFAIGSTRVSCSATDKAGNTGSASFAVNVVDRIPPTLQLPSDMTVQGTGSGGAAVTFSVSASDLVDGSLPVTCNPASGSAFPYGATEVSCSAVDRAGNTATGSFKVTVQDKTPPVLTLPASMIVNATGPGGAVVTFTVSASDAADGPVTSVCVPSSGSTFAFGSTKISCSAMDKAGNAVNGTFTITVQDKTAPVLTVPADMIVEATSSKGAAVTFTASAVDLVDGSLPPTCTPASGSAFALGSAKVTCSVTDKAGNTASASFKVTVPTVTVTLLASNGSGLSGAVVQYYSGSWKAFGTTGSDGTAKLALASGTYNFRISWAGATQQKSQNVGTNPNVVFQTTLVTVKLVSSANVQLSGGAQYYAGSWKTFGGGTTTTTMELLPLTYSFQVTYAGSSQQKSQNVASNPNVVFQTTLVTVRLLSSTGAELSGGVQYYAGGWKTFGAGTTTTTMELLPNTYNFQITYAGASQQKSQNVASGANVLFQTTLVTLKLLSSNGVTELVGGAQYNAGGWKTFGGGTTTTTMELLPLTYTFKISYGGASQQKSQNVGTNPNVVFQTTQVTMKLVSSGNMQLSAGAQYYAGGWKTFGAGTTTATMELLPLTYKFQVSWAGASQQKSQDVSKDANVVFQTVQAHSDSGKCTSYYAGRWRTFTQDMELLPGSYKFRFSDKTKDTSYTLVVGAIKHIH